MVQIKIQRPSAGVLSRMRNGHAVRIHAHIDGEGLVLDVNPETYDSWTHAFRKGKAIQYAMPPDEIAGSGLRDDLIKTGNAIGRAGKSKRGRQIMGALTDRAVKEIRGGDMRSDLIKTGNAIGRAGKSSRGRQIMGALTDRAVKEIRGGDFRSDLIKTGNAIGRAGKSKRGRQIMGALTDRAVKEISGHGLGMGYGLGDHMGVDLSALNQLTGQHMGFLSHANRGLALAGLENDKIAHGLATARGQHGVGLYAQAHSHPMGCGVRTDPMSRLHEFSSIGRHGNLLGGGLPPALMSQPLSQNFQWGTRLPVQYQSIGKGLH